MLTHYSPLKVAEQFRMLETLHPGRIDLGIGRAPGSDGRTALALRRGADAARGPEVPDPWAETEVARFPDQVGDLIGFLTDGLPPDHRFSTVRAMPAGDGVPEIWLLGSTDASAACAAHFGTAFSFAHFINADGGAAVTRAYARAFRPSPSPRRGPRQRGGLRGVRGHRGRGRAPVAEPGPLHRAPVHGTRRPLPVRRGSRALSYSPRELAIAEHARRRTVAGTPEQVRAASSPWPPSTASTRWSSSPSPTIPKARLRSYELLAEAFGLRGDPA